MARIAKPWYRDSEDGWYVYRHGKQVLLAKGKDNKKAALKAFHILMADGDAEKPVRTKIAKVFDLFLERCQTETESYDWYKTYLDDAAKSFGAVLYSQLKVHHLTRWMKDKTWTDTTKNKAIGAVKAAINYCVQQGHVPAPNPIAHLKKPPCGVRDRIAQLFESHLLADWSCPRIAQNVPEARRLGIGMT